MISVHEVPEELRPDNWYLNPYWVFSGALSREEVLKFLRGDVDVLLARKVAQYVLDYVCNMASATYLALPPGDRDLYLRFMAPVIRRLREVKERVRSRDDVWDMVETALDVGMDPF